MTSNDIRQQYVSDDSVDDGTFRLFWVVEIEAIGSKKHKDCSEPKKSGIEHKN